MRGRKPRDLYVFSNGLLTRTYLSVRRVEKRPGSFVVHYGETGRDELDNGDYYCYWSGRDDHEQDLDWI